MNESTQAVASAAVSPGAQMPDEAIVVRQDITLKELAQTFVASGFWKDATTAAQAVVKIMAGHELGIPPIASMTSVHVFDGKVELGAKLLSALIKRAPQYRYKQVSIDDEKCVLEFFEREREDRAWSPWESMGESTFTFDEAKQANLTNKHNWKAWRQDMLFARALSRGFRRFCSDLAGGATLYVEGEISEAATTVSPQRRNATVALNSRLLVEQDDAAALTSTEAPKRSQSDSSTPESAPQGALSVESDEQSAPDATKRVGSSHQSASDTDSADNSSGIGPAPESNPDALSTEELQLSARALEKSLGWAPNAQTCRDYREQHLGTTKLTQAPHASLLSYIAELRTVETTQRNVDAEFVVADGDDDRANQDAFSF